MGTSILKATTLITLAASLTTVAAAPPACLLACVAQVEKKSKDCDGLNDIECICSHDSSAIELCLESACPSDVASSAKDSYEETCKGFGGIKNVSSSASSSASSSSVASSSASSSSVVLSSASSSSVVSSSAPVSSAPASSAPASSAPASSAPASSAPASSAPASSAPVSSAPVSSAPVSSAPVSSAPASSAPATTVVPIISSAESSSDAVPTSIATQSNVNGANARELSFGAAVAGLVVALL